MPVDAKILEALKAAAAAAEDYRAVAREISAGEGEPDMRLRPFVLAFSYPLLAPGSDARERRGGPFGAMIVYQDGHRFPPPVGDVEDEDVDAWRDAFDQIDHPLVKARLGDVLWERKAQPAPHVYAQAACDAYIEMAADSKLRIFERIHGLARALELTRVLKDTERQAKVVECMLNLAQANVDSEDGGPGIALGLLKPLLDLPATQRPADLDQRLVKVEERYGQDPHIVDDVAALRARLVTAGQRQELALVQVERWRKEAKKGDAMLRVIHLEHALELAREHGLREQADELRAELGKIDPEDLDLKAIGTDLEFPAEVVERFRSQFREAPSWEVAMKLLAAQPAPGGTPEEVGTQVDQEMADFPVQFLMTKAVIGPDNATAIFKASDPISHRKLALAEARARSARLWGLFCADAIELIGARDDRPSREQLTEFFTTELIEPEIAERLARTLELHWNGEFDEASHILVPRLEAVIRQLARQVGLPVVREPRPDREVGGVEMLGALLRELQGAFADKAWHDYLLNVLADPLGLNLRNKISHGLAGIVGRNDSALLIQIAVYFSQLGLKPVEPAPKLPPDAGMA